MDGSARLAHIVYPIADCAFECVDEIVGFATNLRARTEALLSSGTADSACAV